MGLSFDILIFDCLLKAPQPVTGLFFKQHIQYLRHLISKAGFEPLPEKLESIHNMPAPRSPKEVKQFLGLIGYYRKFVPHFSDMSRPLTHLTQHDVKFKWTEKCEKLFNHLQELLMEYLILSILTHQSHIQSTLM